MGKNKQLDLFKQLEETRPFIEHDEKPSITPINSMDQTYVEEYNTEAKLISAFKKYVEEIKDDRFVFTLDKSTWVYRNFKMFYKLEDNYLIKIESNDKTYSLWLDYNIAKDCWHISCYDSDEQNAIIYDTYKKISVKMIYDLIQEEVLNKLA